MSGLSWEAKCLVVYMSICSYYALLVIIRLFVKISPFSAARFAVNTVNIVDILILMMPFL